VAGGQGWVARGTRRVIIIIRSKRPISDDDSPLLLQCTYIYTTHTTPPLTHAHTHILYIYIYRIVLVRTICREPRITPRTQAEGRQVRVRHAKRDRIYIYIARRRLRRRLYKSYRGRDGECLQTFTIALHTHTHIASILYIHRHTLFLSALSSLHTAASAHHNIVYIYIRCSSTGHTHAHTILLLLLLLQYAA